MESVLNNRQVAEYVVIDSGGFIKNAPVHEYGRELITNLDVVSEIRDKATKQRLQALPFELQYKEPDTESIKRVSEFAKKTGDYGSLSLTDIKVLALTYMLEAQYVGTDHIPEVPTIKRTVELSKPQNTSNASGEVDTKKETANFPAGFVYPEEEEDDEKDEENASSESLKEDDLPKHSEEEEEEDESDDDEGWITPKNLQQKQLAMFGIDSKKERKIVKVACMTTDFAMQNVLIQMGLNVISVDGVVVEEAKTWIKRCYACYKVVPDVSKEFCPNCGHKTLKRVSVTVDHDGSMRIHISSRKPLSGRGTKFPLPAPKGGKHAFNPILCADQPMPQQHLSRKARMKTSALDPDFIAGSSPFSTKDVTSKSAMLNIGGQHKYWMKRNPNETGRKTGNRKRK